MNAWSLSVDLSANPDTEGRLITLTAMMYAVVEKVVMPARISVERRASSISFGWWRHFC
jgi:hypothetical protein